jgi:hypothetical protein
MEDRTEQSMSPLRSCLITTVAISALAVFGIVVLAVARSRQMSLQNVEVRGFAADYIQLAATPVIGERVVYFPRLARNIEYWCRPYARGINGSFDIEEKDFLDWANTFGWQLRKLRPTELEPTILLMHRNGSQEYLDRPEDCYFYQCQTFKKPFHQSRDFEIVYDKTKKRVYFDDTDGRTGPPSGE